ncbi:Gfo/Idh/MocA family oxidoreductase [Spiroplasma sp. SV19]|uniref:Gfo/Idh/MocA family protein n=1 Tax=Spiroplasma sp. SV19 TaxID=2570468 RepID=UPI0024B73C2D|nr:Gfo/Idh/MocA family oxidoreductase [Spiroplasma sp. SV19]WHQ37023.1 gfo/Idh/MocA family oxidoreductase [Spiroplasma sp. SV19]
MKIVFIGAGRITKWFLNDLKNTKYHDKIKLFGIYNLTYEKAVQYQSEYQIQKVYCSLDDVLQDAANFDLAYIGTSDATHYEIAKQLLANKINVFCEKPLTLSYQTAKELYDLASINNVLLFDGIKTGFSPVYRLMRNDIAAGLIGAIEYLSASHAKVSTSGKKPQPVPNDSNFVGLHLAGGMYALFIGLDLLGPVQLVTHLNNAYSTHTAISTSVLNLRHKNNGISTILSSDNLSSDLSAQILGTAGYIKLGGNLQKYNVDYHKDSCHMAYTYQVYDLQGNLIKTVDKQLVTDGEGLCFEIEHVYELWKNQKIESDVVTKAISLEIIKILELTNNTNDKEIIEL